MQEIERKFLVDTKKWRPSGKGTKYIQGYLSDDPERIVRVRIAEEKAYLTIKGKVEGISRTEIEYEIPKNDAEVLMRMVLNNPVEKTRYKESVGGFTWEIDVFEGRNKGLFLAEIELENENQDFKLPDWAGTEVSHDKRFYNSHLSKKPYKDW